ncbi:mitochondrial inner membrane protease subunit 2 isoform X2 [Hippoglossus hippoglossus]|uniref:mitochondrial inner membrane protease subunit 2 isoform X2 n=1 Tax=Hippoglossus hippoglossus TaxID=8267 RepID=UPI00148CC8DD|nr:mitochondrial inner membrane protease subunit 2 isoform X2 [Hippoglossus hippoglossus]
MAGDGPAGDGGVALRAGVRQRPLRRRSSHSHRPRSIRLRGSSGGSVDAAVPEPRQRLGLRRRPPEPLEREELRGPTRRHRLRLVSKEPPAEDHQEGHRPGGRLHQDSELQEPIRPSSRRSLLDRGGSSRPQSGQQQLRTGVGRAASRPSFSHHLASTTLAGNPTVPPPQQRPAGH